MNSSRPILAITMGDPAGIGPEIVVKACASEAVKAICRPLAIGDAAVFRRAAGWVGGGAIHPIQRIDQARFAPSALDVLDQQSVDLETFAIGKVSAAGGEAAFAAVRSAIELALAGAVDATVTAPLHKGALHLAGHRYPGHTEIFADLTGTQDYTMMLAAGSMRVVHVSTHLSLRQACDAVTARRVRDVIDLGRRAVEQLGIPQPRIGVAGLNPHAGDGGLFGDEETAHIIPAIEAARQAGINVIGPIPPDTFFAQAAGGAYDLCVAMYHDQGHIPVKMLGFRYDAAKRRWSSVRGINVTLGLPIIRTSVDHGTAFDQAGTGQADEQSMIDAIEYAAKLARGKILAEA